MANEKQNLKSEILRLVSEAWQQRLKPYELESTCAHNLGVPVHTVQQAVGDLVEEGNLVYTYRDPASYIELAERGAPVHPVV